MDRKRVCVIGAGIAGLATANVMGEDSFDVTVYEKEPTVGEVWAESRTYPGLRANDLKEIYAFSDFPYPADADTFPTPEQIRGYLNGYADHFGLRRHIRHSTSVRCVSRKGEGFSGTVGPGGGVVRGGGVALERGAGRGSVAGEASGGGRGEVGAGLRGGRRAGCGRTGRWGRGYGRRCCGTTR